MSQQLQRDIVLEPEEDVPAGEKRLYNKSAHKSPRIIWKIRPSLHFVDVISPILHYIGYQLIHSKFTPYMGIVAKEMNERFDTNVFTQGNCVGHLSQLKEEMLTLSELIANKDAEYDEETGFLRMEPYAYLGYNVGLKETMGHSVKAVLSKNMKDVYAFWLLFKNDVRLKPVREVLDYKYADFYKKWQKEGYFMEFVHPDDDEYGKPQTKKPQQEPTPVKTTTHQRQEPIPTNPSKEKTPPSSLPEPSPSLPNPTSANVKTEETASTAPLSPESTSEEDEVEPHPDDDVSDEYIYKRTVAIEGLIRLYKAGLLNLGEAVKMGRNIKSAGPTHTMEIFADAPAEMLRGILG